MNFEYVYNNLCMVTCYRINDDINADTDPVQEKCMFGLEKKNVNVNW